MELVNPHPSGAESDVERIVDAITEHLVRLIRDTNGITLDETLDLACASALIQTEEEVSRTLLETF